MLASNLIRAIYRAGIGAAAGAMLPFRARDRSVAVFYGGARSGSGGGPLVKVGLLSRRFPERYVGFSILYVLSNAIYLPRSVVAAFKSAGVPIVLNQNGVYYPAWYPHGWQRENARMAFVHDAASHVLYQSEFCRKCAEKFLGPRRGPSEILYNAVDTEAFTPAERTARQFTFLVTGKIGPATAYRLYASIEGIAAARKGGLDVRLAVAGAIEKNVERSARGLTESHDVVDAVIWRGPYTHAEAPGIYRDADAYLMFKHNDPCPNVVLEALSSGLPVLYSASGGVPELVGGEAGIGLQVAESFEECPAPDAPAIAGGMAQIMAGREQMADAARKRAKARFDLETWLDRHAALFKSLADSVGSA